MLCSRQIWIDKKYSEVLSFFLFFPFFSFIFENQSSSTFMHEKNEGKENLRHASTQKEKKENFKLNYCFS